MAHVNGHSKMHMYGWSTKIHLCVIFPMGQYRRITLCIGMGAYNTYSPMSRIAHQLGPLLP